jgi:beta-glucosidase
MKNSAFNTEVYASIARKTQAEGVVMLENRDGALPLPAGTRVALFGRSQFQYYKSGTGSGGMVNTAYVTGVREAILQREAYVLSPTLEKAYAAWLPDHPFDQGCGWGAEPWFQEEMEISRELAQIAAKAAGTRVVFDLPDELEQKGFGKAKDSVLRADKLTALGYAPAYSAEKGITVSVSIIHDLEFAGPQS